MGEGLASFQRRMAAIPRAAREAVKPSVVDAANELAALQRQLAPKDTGALAASIVVTGPGEATPAYSQPGGSMTVPENAAAVTVGNTAVRYAHLAEFGTADTPAQPYFWPAYRLLRKRLGTKIKRSIGKAVREAK